MQCFPDIKLYIYMYDASLTTELIMMVTMMHYPAPSSSASHYVLLLSLPLQSHHLTTVFITIPHCPCWVVSDLSLLMLFLLCHPWFHCLWCTWYWVRALERDSTLLHHFLQFYRGHKCKGVLSHLSIPYHSVASSFPPSVCVCVCLCEFFSF